MVKKFFKAFVAVVLAFSLIGMTACDAISNLFGKGTTKHNVTLVLNGGTLSENFTYYEEGKEAVLPIPVRENYVFEGWYETADFSDGTATEKISDTETEDKIFYAKWLPKTYTVTLNLNGGELIKNLTEYTYGKGAVLPTPTKNGKIFDGWYDSANAGNKVTAIAKTDSGNKEFWARWSGQKSKLTLVLDGGTLAKEMTTYEEGEETPLPTPTKNYYDFEGWHLKSDLSDTKADKITADKTGNQTYYAKWTPQKYAVTLNLNGGSGASLSEYTYGTGATLPVPTKSGNAFDGWFENSDFSGNKVEKISTTDNGNKIFYAKWISNTNLNISSFGGYEEGAFIVFNKLGGVADNGYTVSYKTDNGAAAYTNIDKQLIRSIDNNTMRADVVGIKAGNYTIKVSAGGKTAEKIVTVTSYDRSGYAHFDASASNQQYAAGVGGYKNDGTPKENAQIIYVSEETKNTVKATINNTSYTGIIAILQALQNSKTPVIIRFLDMVKAATWNTISYKDYIQSGLLDKDNKEYTGVTLDIVIAHTPSTKSSSTSLEKKQYSMQELIDAGFNTLNTDVNNDGCSELNGLSAISYLKYDSSKKEFDSCWNDCGIGSSSKHPTNITIEGIGPNAGLFQWGMTWRYATSIEVRNLKFDDYNEDACSFEGGTNSETVDGFDSNRIWLHHCTFEEGKNYWDVCNEQDKGDGDGSTDFKKCAYISIAYNHYIDTHKTGLIGGGNDHKTANVTFHHNYYQHCKARLPLARQANMHMYNNYYENTTDTCLSIRAGGYAFVEYCYFKNASGAIKTESGDSKNGFVKVFNCKFEGKSLSATSYIKETTDRTKTYTNDNIYNKTFDTVVFDVSTNYFYYDATNKCSKVTNLITTLSEIPTKVPEVAGVHKN